MSNSPYKENLHSIPSELEDPTVLLMEGASRFKDGEPPEIKTVEIRRPFWPTAILAASVSGIVFLGLNLMPWSASSPVLGATMNFVASVCASLLSIGINDKLIERSQSHMEFTEDVRVRRTRRWVLRRSYDRKKPSRGT